ncbi:MAG: LPS assembly lipoprotein LptE [Desulfobacterales bacterium]|nr:LPS assembly lipoprotein LptE [Desulfobacterales bacterium]
MTHSKLSLIIFIFIMGALIGACGYRFAEQGGFPGDNERLFVKILENRTQETGVENIITAELLSELTLRKTHHLAKDMADADVVLSGVVKHVNIRTISVSQPTVADERRVTVSIDLKLTDTEGKTVWVAQEISDFEAYLVTLDPEITDANRRTAISVLSKRIAEKVVNRFSDDF